MAATKILGLNWTIPIFAGIFIGAPIFTGLISGAVLEVWSSAILVIALAVPVALRWSKVGIWAESDQLEIINFTSSRTIPRNGVRLSTEEGSEGSAWTELDPGFAPAERRLYLHPSDGSAPVSVSAVRVMSERQYHDAILQTASVLA